MVRRRASCIGDGSWRQSIIYVGLDVHKDTIAVALAEAGLRGEVREHGKIANTPAALKALTERLAGKEGSCGFATRPDRAAMASNDNSARSGTNVPWSLRR